MRIQNLIGTTIFFPYAGINAARGKDIKADEFSVELETTRFDNPLLKRDWEKGKIAILLNEKDKEVLGAEVVAEIESKGSRPMHKYVEAVEVIPAVSEEDASEVEEIEPSVIDDEVKDFVDEETSEEPKEEEPKEEIVEEVKTEEVKEEESDDEEEDDKDESKPKKKRGRKKQKSIADLN